MLSLKKKIARGTGNALEREREREVFNKLYSLQEASLLSMKAK
jgi:hypothetical protein